MSFTRRVPAIGDLIVLGHEYKHREAEVIDIAYARDGEVDTAKVRYSTFGARKRLGFGSWILSGGKHQQARQQFEVFAGGGTTSMKRLSSAKREEIMRVALYRIANMAEMDGSIGAQAKEIAQKALDDTQPNERDKYERS